MPTVFLDCAHCCLPGTPAALLDARGTSFFLPFCNLEGRFHSLDGASGDLVLMSKVLPILVYDCGHCCDRLCCFFGRELVEFGCIQSQLDVQGAIFFGDAEREVFPDWIWIDVVERGEMPSIFAEKKAMIAQMVICICDENVENHTTPELRKVFLWAGAIGGEPVGDIQVGSIVCVIRLIEHCHRGSHVYSFALLAIETPYEKGRPFFCELESLCFGDMEMTMCCKAMSNHLPCSGIFFIVAGRKLSNPQIPLFVLHSSLGAGTT